MHIFPAVDIQLGRVARGPTASNFADPVSAARRFVADGASWIHVVDLDRARAAGRENDAVVRAIVSQVTARVQIGGLLRTAAQVRAALALGATRAVADAAMRPQELAALVSDIGPDRLALGLNLRGGQMGPEILGALERAAPLGIRMVIYRDLGRDGELDGPDLEGARPLVGRCDELVLAGGVGCLEDVAAARAAGLAGLIIGRALVEGRFSLSEAMAWAR